MVVESLVSGILVFVFNCLCVSDGSCRWYQWTLLGMVLVVAMKPGLGFPAVHSLSQCPYWFRWTTVMHLRLNFSRVCMRFGATQGRFFFNFSLLPNPSLPSLILVLNVVHFHRTYSYIDPYNGPLPEYFITFHLHYISFALHYICI